MVSFVPQGPPMGLRESTHPALYTANMTLQVPPGYSNVSFIFDAQSTLGSRPVWSIGISAPPTEDYLDGFEAWYDSDYRPLMDSNTVLNRIEMRNEVAVLVRPMNSGGSLASSGSAPQVTALVQKVTGLVGRQNRGRMNWVGVVPEASVSEDGSLEPGLITSLQGTADTLMALATSTGDELTLFHNGSSDPTIITSLAVSRQSATIRRRNRR